jgi:hypothetical protein
VEIEWMGVGRGLASYEALLQAMRGLMYDPRSLSPSPPPLTLVCRWAAKALSWPPLSEQPRPTEERKEGEESGKEGEESGAPQEEAGSESKAMLEQWRETGAQHGLSWARKPALDRAPLRFQTNPAVFALRVRVASPRSFVSDALTLSQLLLSVGAGATFSPETSAGRRCEQQRGAGVAFQSLAGRMERWRIIRCLLVSWMLPGFCIGC